MKKTVLMTIFVGLIIGVSSYGNLQSAQAQARRPDDVQVTGKWELVGKEGEWKNAVEMVAMDGALWSVEKDGSLYKTDPANGKRTQVGEKGSFEKVQNLEGWDHMLWSIEAGTLYKNDPKTGKWEQASKEGEWSKTIDFVALGAFLYSIEPDGSLWKTDKSGTNTLIDKGEFKGCTRLTEMGGKLWTIEDGTLYETDPATLKWKQVGKEGEFSKINAMEGTKTYIFMIDKSGNLYKVDADGKKTLLGDDYGETRILTTLDGRLWTVEGGSLYKTS
jgi:hypothetical protein